MPSRAWIVLLLMVFGSLNILTAQDSTPGICQFCETEQPSTAYICTNCGRLFKIASLEPSNRFWADAFYILRLPTITSRPQLVAEIGPDGLLREAAAFDLGDRYRYEVTKKGVEISGRVHAFNSKEVEFFATFEDQHDDTGRLIRRTIQGELRCKPRRFLYRSIGFSYDGDRLELAEVASSIYGKANDWEKRPTGWIRHSKVDIRLEYDDGVLSRVHARRRHGRRDLRGNADYESTEGFSESVLVDGGVVVGFGTPELMEEEK